MSTFEVASTVPRDEPATISFASRLPWLAPALGAMVYPFLLKLFHLLLAGEDGGRPSAPHIFMAAPWLICALAVPALGLTQAWLASRRPATGFNLRARRLGYFAVGAPPLYVLISVTRGLLHLHVSDEAVWEPLWALAAVWTLAGRAAPTASAGPPAARWRILHGAAAAVLVLYVLFHLANHLTGLIGPDLHTAVMKAGRRIYRAPPIEPVLIGLLLWQVVSGARLAWRWSSAPADTYRVFQIGSGAYLAAFILTHVNSALISARLVHRIDTGWAWASGGSAGLLADAWNIRLVPHYALGVFFVLGHLASGLRGVALAHGVEARVANRLWGAALAASALVAVAILSGLCGVRI